MGQQFKYQPPDTTVIDQYAREVCRRLAKERNDPRFENPEIVRGLANWLRLITDILARDLSETEVNSVDN